MLRVGLVGATASGKSTVARILSGHGIPVLDADREAHALYAPGSPLVATLVEEFGETVRGEAGGIDRRALGRIVFSDADRLARLEALVHPPLRVRLHRALAELAADGHDLAVLEAAVLLKWREAAGADSQPLVDRIVAVTARRELRLQRLMAKGLTEAEALSRLDRQVDEVRLRRIADFEIENNDDAHALRERVHLLAVMLRRLAADAARS